MMSNPKILYIVGEARSGTTLLGQLLNELDGFVFPGEMTWLWRLVLQQGDVPLPMTCGCNQAVATCETWQAVMRAWATKMAKADRSAQPERMLILQRKFQTWPRCVRLHGRDSTAAAQDPLFGEYVEACQLLYDAVADVSGAGVIVDSSKSPLAAALVAFLPRSAVYYVHLVRDPRGVAWSVEKRRRYRLRHYPHTARWWERSAGLVFSRATASWIRNNAAGEILPRLAGGHPVLRLRYEDFATRPRHTLETVLRFTRQPAQRLPLVDENLALVGANHTVHGNQLRRKRGLVPIRPDVAWQHCLSAPARLWITVLAYPWLRRYGYGVEGSRQARVSSSIPEADPSPSIESGRGHELDG